MGNRWSLIVSRWLLILLFAWPALAQSPSLDRDKPIEITADELEVRQNEQQAIFKGNVIATQGQIKMQSARMIVHYKGGGEGASIAAGANGISKIEADGGVFFQSARETAKGSSAVYDVNAEQIRMSGDVALTRDQSIVKGSSLVYNLKTGRSVLGSGGGPTTSNPSGRVRGLFVPNQAGQQ